MGKAITTYELALKVRDMRTGQKQYFTIIGKARKSKLPADFAEAAAVLTRSKQLEKDVDEAVEGIYLAGREATL